MSKSNTFESDLLKLFFQAVAMANVADNAAAAPITNLWISLHTADPGEAGDQTTNEATYTSYARVSVTRDVTGWTVSGTTQVTNAGTVTFPQCTGGANTLTHFGVGTGSAGAGKLLYSGALNGPINISNLIAPDFAAGTLVVIED
jgi:hypothetical protein